MPKINYEKEITQPDSLLQEMTLFLKFLTPNLQKLNQNKNMAPLQGILVAWQPKANESRMHL